MHKTLTLVTLLVASAELSGAPPASAGTLEWVRQLGPAVNGGVSADSLGNVFISGHTGVSLGDPFAGGVTDVWVAKYDAVTADLQWIRQLGTTADDHIRGVSADGLGNVYISGFTRGSLGGPNAGDWDAFVVKYNAAGSLQWTRQLGTAARDESFGVSGDGLGNVYISGFTQGSLEGPNAGNQDAFVAKYDAAGTREWTRQLGTTSADESHGVSADGLGNVYISGFTRGSLGGPNAGDFDAFVSKYNAAGNLQWTRQLGTPTIDNSLGVSADKLGNVYISGYTRGGSLGGPPAGGDDAFVAKYDAAGDLQWTRQLGTSSPDQSLGVSADGLGNIYISGHTSGSLGGQPHAGGADAWIAKYDADGALLWTRQLGTSSSDQSRGVSADGLGNVYISGGTQGSLGGPHAGGTDAFVAKFVDGQPGDFNSDGVADGFDFLAWQRGESPDPLSATDLTAWKADFGAGPAALPGQTAVPEPTALPLILAAVVAILSRDRLRRRVSPKLALALPSGSLPIEDGQGTGVKPKLILVSSSFTFCLLLALAACTQPARPARAQAVQILRWEFEATLVELIDPRGVFGDVRLGDPVTGAMAYDLSLEPDPDYLPELGLYFPPAWFIAASATLHNPRTGGALRFVPDDFGYEFTQVIVTNDFDVEEIGLQDSLLAIQTVLGPPGFDGVVPVVAVSFLGPPTVVADASLPTELTLDDWPVVAISFFDLHFADEDDTSFAAEVYSITAVAVAPGDFNADGGVGGADLVVWQEEFGKQQYAYGDADADGDADGADFLAWQRHFGGPAAAAHSVPEPAGGAIALLACVAVRLAGRHISPTRFVLAGAVSAAWPGARHRDDAG